MNKFRKLGGIEYNGDDRRLIDIPRSGKAQVALLYRPILRPCCISAKKDVDHRVKPGDDAVGMMRLDKPDSGARGPGSHRRCT
jgi:hypothetical protein